MLRRHEAHGDLHDWLRCNGRHGSPSRRGSFQIGTMRAAAYSPKSIHRKWICDRRNGVQGSSCTAAILSCQCPLWVKSRHLAHSTEPSGRPIFPYRNVHYSLLPRVKAPSLKFSPNHKMINGDPATAVHQEVESSRNSWLVPCSRLDSWW